MIAVLGSLLMRVERTLPQPGTDDELYGALAAHAAALGLRLRIDEAAGVARLKGGDLLGFNPNALRMTVAIGGIGRRGSPLAIAAEADALPWERPRVRRILNGHLDRLSQRLGGEDPGDAPFAVWRGPAATGVPAVLGGILLSGLLAVLGAMLVMGVYGWIQVDETAARLAAQGRRIAALGETPVPPPDALKDLPFAARAAAAGFFAVPFGFLCGAILALAWGLGELVPRWNILGPVASVFIPLWLLFCFVPAGPLVPAVACAVLLPAAAWTGYSLAWSCRRLVPAGPGAPASARPRTVALSIFGFTVFGAAVGAGFYLLTGLHAAGNLRPGADRWGEAAVGFRDRILLGMPWGRALTRYYYTHTYLPAEAILPPALRRQRIALVLGDPAALPATARRGAQMRMPILPDSDEIPWYYIDPVRAPETLAEHLRPLPDVVLWVLQSPTDDPFLHAVRARRDLFPRLVIIGDARFAAGDAVAWPHDRILAAPAHPEKLAAALQSVADGHDRTLLLRDLVGTSLRSLVLGAGWLLAGGVVWSAWAWAALGACAAGGHAGARKAAWVLGPPAALAAWVALGAAVCRGGLGVCPAPDPSADPAKTLASADPCGRLDAVQQLVARLPAETALRSHANRDALLWRLRDPDPRVRFWSIAALEQFRDPLTVPMLAQMLKDPELTVRYRAADALGDVGDAAAVAPLEAMTRSEPWYAANYARAALRNLAARGVAP